MATSYHINNINTTNTNSNSHRQRPSSPYNPTSVDGHIPGHPSNPSAIHYHQHHHHNSSVSPSNSSFNSNSSILGRGTALALPTGVRSMTPTTFKFKFNGSPPPPPPHSPHPPPSTSSPNSFTSNGPASNLLGFQASRGVGAGSDNAKENVVVTVRFRPLSLREIQKGDEIAWYADGDTTVRSEYNPSSAYGFDRVFGPATTTKAVYDTAAKQVVRGAMEGINGTVFAYGVTSSGKTHTMHGDQRSPGIIPLAVKDVFNIIQDTPGREYLLRVSYLEIYNEIINDLLDPAGQNLRIREDSQGTYVEGVKEEVVLSPAHALSLIAAGEEHRHVGSNNFNLLSSRSHTIFTLTIESSARTGDSYDDEISLSQLNLIDLAGSESSKTETTGLRRKEGSYINKSLLTLGTVIGKLSEGKASHVPFRDSKLTRLLQSSLSGYGRVSLICTLTPASSNIEETHNTLKFAHRAKRVAIYAAPNRIMDEKSLIKKYQKEIYCLKQELDQMKRGMFDKSYHNNGNTHEDLLSLRQQLEAGQVKLQSRLEEEEQAKSALLGRIQRLTKLILVSTKTTIPQEPEKPIHRRCHSFGEEDLKYLGAKRRELGLDFDDDDDDGGGSVGHNQESSFEGKLDGDEVAKEDKKNKRRGMLGWFKLLRNGNLNPSSMSMDADISPSESPSQNGMNMDRRRSLSRKNYENASGFDSFPQFTQAGELFSATIHGRRPAPTGETVADQMDLLREQAKMLAGEVGFCTSSLKRMAEQASINPDDVQFQAQMEKMKNEIQEKRHQIEILERRILAASQAALNNASPVEMSQTISKLMGQLNEKQFELELKTADNRILQEQLQTKTSEIKQLQDMITTMQQQSTLVEEDSTNMNSGYYQRLLNARPLNSAKISSDMETDVLRSNKLRPISDSKLQSQVLKQAAEIERLEQEKDNLMEENGGLQIQGLKLAEEASYAKELASAAAVELKNLAEEVKKLSLQNSQLTNELIAVQEASFSRLSNNPSTNGGYAKVSHVKLTQERAWTGRDVDDDVADFDSWELDPDDMKMELKARKEREKNLEAALLDKEQIETELRKKLEEAKQREANLENDLAGMWVVVAQLKMEKRTSELEVDDNANCGKGADTHRSVEELQCILEEEKQRSSELKKLISRLKGEELEGLPFSTLEELQSLHMDALTKLCQAKAKGRETGWPASLEKQPEERHGHICKVCFEAPTAAVLLPCRHFCLCKPCAVACTECPLCRSGIADRIITFTS